MNFTEYESLAKRTLKELPRLKHIEHMVMGMSGELGEIVDAYKKYLVYGKPLDKVNIIEEVGDFTWYAILLGFVYNIKPEDIEIYFFLEYSRTVELLKGTNEDENLPVFLLGASSNINEVCFRLLALEEYESGPEKIEIVNNYLKLLWKVVTSLIVMLDINIEQVFEANIAKLAARYGDKYSDLAAITRDLDKERKILESKT